MAGPATRNALRAARLPVEVTGASRTLGQADAAAYLWFTNAGEKACMVAAQADVAWIDATEIPLRNGPAGNLTVTAGAGVSVESPGGGTLVLGPGMTAMLYRVAVDTWHLLGQSEAA